MYPIAVATAIATAVRGGPGDVDPHGPATAAPGPGAVLGAWRQGHEIGKGGRNISEEWLINI